MKLILENVRCFSGRHQIPIRPLTLLVGENSSGKTTALAMLSVALSRSGFGFRPDFNKPPYDLGNFRTTVSLGKRRSDAEQFFSIGLEFADDAPTKLRTLHARFGDAEGQPNLRKLRVETVSGSVEIDASPERVRYVVTGGDTKFEFNAEMARHWQERGASLSELLFYSMFQRKYDRKRQNWLVENVIGPAGAIGEASSSVISLAPVRTKPERTYDTPRSGFLPQGEHIPFALAKILGRNGDSRRNEGLSRAIQDFGHESGLYDSISVKRLGQHQGDPFQLLVSAAGAPTNLADVGYGVSQCLPIIVESVLAKKGSWILTQQPEVHLHPQAQAALGSFFCGLVAAKSKKFVIETHSDFIVDRVRQEVAKGTIASDAVILLYAGKHSGKAQIHPIEIDPDGNLVGTPKGYREFFLKEELDLLSR